MKVIFLDVDGVLNHGACPEWENGDWRVLDQACVARVKAICTATGARIVLSSTWRTCEPGLAAMREAFGDLIIDVTPQFFSSIPRRRDILAWLENRTDVEQFVVIDDEADAEVEGRPFVRTSFTGGGLTSSLAAAVLKILEN